jgi:beta-phosphoglucomutase-like phosphatase (HAD superfamily)
MRYETVLLDIDGTIADSNDAHAHAWVVLMIRRLLTGLWERWRGWRGQC